MNLFESQNSNIKSRFENKNYNHKAKENNLLEEILESDP